MNPAPSTRASLLIRLRDPRDHAAWVEFVNIYEPVCHHGYDETCTLNLDVSNQPACAHTLGSMDTLSGHAIMVPEYGTGKMVECM